MTEISLDEVVRGQCASEAIRGQIVAGFCVAGLRDAAALRALAALAKDAGLALVYGAGDAGNAEDGTLVGAPWLVGVSLQKAEGGGEQERGFTYEELAEARVKAEAALDAAKGALSAFAAAHTVSGELEGPALYLVATGGLALVNLMYGAWESAPDPDDDEDAFEEWLEARDEETDTFRYGTIGATQDPYPGGVRGLRVASADDEGPVKVTVDPEVHEAHVGAAGLGRYFLVTRYD